MAELTHFNEQGRARMVDVTEKAVTHRRAVAAGEIHMAPETLQNIKDGTLKKGVTGVEMEALTAVSVAALTIYDMCKAVQKDMRIENIRLLSKSGGKSGDYQIKE